MPNFDRNCFCAASKMGLNGPFCFPKTSIISPCQTLIGIRRLPFSLIAARLIVVLWNSHASAYRTSFLTMASGLSASPSTSILSPSFSSSSSSLSSSDAGARLRPRCVLWATSSSDSSSSCAYVCEHWNRHFKVILLLPDDVF